MTRMPPARRASVARRLARRRWARRTAFTIVALLAASVLLGYTGLLGRAGDDWSAFDRRRFHVVRAVDGETLLVRPVGGGAETRVRLVGLAAPSGYWSDEARQYLAGRSTGKDVSLRLEPTQTRTAGGDLLAHVYAAEGEELNLALVREGQAYAERRAPHSMHNQFDQAEAEARLRRRGLWRSVTDEQMPPWRQAWLRAVREKKRERMARPATRQAAP